ncbi:ABC-type sugar transport system ATPase subunit [Paraburkholderia sp. MM5482-R1]
MIYQLAERGCAIVMISSELPEVLGVSDRIVVMRQGRISGELARKDATEQSVLSLALPQSSTALPENANADAANQSASRAA